MLDRTWLRPAPTAAQRRADLVLAVVAAMASVVTVELFHSASGAGLGWAGVEAYLLFALAGLVLTWRRSWPLTSMLAEAGLFIVIGERLPMLGVTFTIQIILFASLYSAWAWSRHARPLKAATALVLVAMFGWLVLALLLRDGALPDVPYGLVDPAVAAFTYSLLLNLVYFLGAIAWGQVAWRGARERQAAEQRTSLELALAEQQRERAVADERVRIARDLHDVVAHHVSSIGIQAAGAERLMSRDPDAARGALSTIGESSRQAVAQMHQLVHLLRESPDDASTDARANRSPQPGLGELESLAEPDGVPLIEHHVVGEAFEVPRTVSVSLFRIAQEAVANVHRHAAARRVSLVVRYLAEPRRVEVEVIDDGRGSPVPHQDGGGFGLAGIRERVAMHDGEFEIGPRPQGGFRVRVRVPVETP